MMHTNFDSHQERKLAGMTNPDPHPEAMKACPREPTAEMIKAGIAYLGLDDSLPASAIDVAETFGAMWDAAPAVPLEVAAHEVAKAVMRYITPHLKHMISFNTLHEAILAAIAQQQPARIEADDDVARELAREVMRLFRYEDMKAADDEEQDEFEATKLTPLFKAALARAGQGTREDGLRKAAAERGRERRIIKVHFLREPAALNRWQNTACGKNGAPCEGYMPRRGTPGEFEDASNRFEATNYPEDVTCKRCLALLNQQDKPHG